MSKENSVKTLENPTIEKSAKFIKTALSERKVLILVGNCSVDYRGRANSKLEFGERILMIKEDRSVLVHRPFGYEPVNWQPAGCLFQTRVIGDILQIRAIRKKPSESVKLSFDNIFLVSVLKLKDTGDFFLHASEADMQKAILIDPSLLEDGFTPITYEKKVEPGFVDIYGQDIEGKLVVVELKRKGAGRDAALQLSKYVNFLKTVTQREIRGILVAPSLAKGVKTILTNLELEFKALDPKKCADLLQKSDSQKLENFF
ncbi:MAG: endonuclease NucS [Candidatus Bathyarchaeota archaeon]|jgi:RecB family endonuclease NucS